MYWLSTVLTAYVVVVIGSRRIVGDAEHKVNNTPGATAFIDFHRFCISLPTLFSQYVN